MSRKAPGEVSRCVLRSTWIGVLGKFATAVPCAKAKIRRKRLLLIDAVNWSERYPSSHPLRNVEDWFARHFQDMRHVELRCVSAQDSPLQAMGDWAGGVILSGSPRDAWSDDPLNAQLTGLIRACQDRAIPFLGVCYGHQLLGRFLGAKVGRHPAGLQLDTVGVALTSAGRNFALFSSMPERFAVLSSHADEVLSVPEGCTLLASGGQTQVQAFAYENLLAGVQFHPEMDPGIVRFLWEARIDDWQDRVQFDFTERLARLQPTPGTEMILRNFAEFFVK